MIMKLQDVSIQSDTDRLILLLRHLGMKQYELAEELGYARAYVEAVINGRSPFTDSFKKRIEEYLESRQIRSEENYEELLNLSLRSINSNT
ncbi:helix-turn-helix transcriptional regulator [Bacillus infantis]|uniref:Helix-turn-helix transcriptional regulator n=2 Tax=Bacillus infantis TaxID=324767 RepID=A0A5D4SAI8_9BACI|nr:helix-turn-helix transcriptional regulator [Bacillus infantis]TYS60677.1 helix-turn-helix transcriptional regulator [Bacillus infantis]